MTESRQDPLSPAGLEELLREAGLAIPPGAAETLSLHAREMLRWNRAIRLTAITDPLEVAVKHVVDSLLLLGFGPFPGRTLDFGSGAGYPGIPLAVCAPESRVVLLEATAKKCAFLSRARALIGLSNIEVVCGRLEKRRSLPIGLFGHVITRAAAPAGEAESLLLPYVVPGGRILLMSGPEKGLRRRDEGDAESPRDARRERRERFLLPRGMGEREIREIRVP